jgi:hypothetical protein
MVPRALAASSGALGYQSALFFGQGGIDMQHERVGIGSEFGDDERRPVLHQAADEMHVARQPIELGDDNRATLVELPGRLERGGKLGPAVERVGTFASLNLGKALDNAETLLGGKPGNGLALRLKAESRFALTSGAHPHIGDCVSHGPFPSTRDTPTTVDVADHRGPARD